MHIYVCRKHAEKMGERVFVYIKFVDWMHPHIVRCLYLSDTDDRRVFFFLAVIAKYDLCFIQKQHT